MSDDGEVSRYGTDSSGRPILMTRYMAEWWEDVVDDLGFRPVITQGAWMARVPGGGAENSEGYHDAGGCLDLRVWDRTQIERERMVRVTRLHAAGGWRRYKSQGMSEDHFHLVLGTDPGISVPALRQWQEYLAGGDGLTGTAPDYEWRPDPIVTKPPEGDEMKDADWDRLDKMLDAKLANLGDVKVDLGDGKAKRKFGAVLGDILAKVRSDRTN